MKHLVRPIRDVPYTDAVDFLDHALGFLVDRARRASVAFAAPRARWGSHAKREVVDLRSPERPHLISKDHERLVEVINMAATIERAIDALKWFSDHSPFDGYIVLECHPSTSSTRAGNDLVLGDVGGTVRVRCEVTDVVSDSAGQNGKEKRDLKNLGCERMFPTDGVRRFICTSAVFAGALASPRRKWRQYHYGYDAHHLGMEDTTLLEIVEPALRAVVPLAGAPTPSDCESVSEERS